jgi:hypothetical protein
MIYVRGGTPTVDPPALVRMVRHILSPLAESMPKAIKGRAEHDRIGRCKNQFSHLIQGRSTDRRSTPRLSDPPLVALQLRFYNEPLRP